MSTLTGGGSEDLIRRVLADTHGISVEQLATAWVIAQGRERGPKPTASTRN